MWYAIFIYLISNIKLQAGQIHLFGEEYKIQLSVCSIIFSGGGAPFVKTYWQKILASRKARIIYGSLVVMSHKSVLTFITLKWPFSM